MENDPNNSYLDPINDPNTALNNPKHDPESDLIDPKHDPKASILTPMTQNPAITHKELAVSINRSTSTAKKYSQELRASGAISRIGGPRAAGGK